MQRTGVNNGTLKSQNRGLVLRLLTTGECTSRIDVAKRTGLSKMAATNIIAGFIEDEILEERETIQVGGKGRNPIQLGLSPKAPKMIGVYIGRNECSVVLNDMHLTVLTKAGFALTRDNREHLFDMICRCIERIQKKAPDERIWGICVSASGAADTENGGFRNLQETAGSGDVSLKSLLEEKFQMPVVLENRYNGAALAEKLYGNGRDVESLLFCGICEEIGSGLLLGGGMRTMYGIQSSLGHISIEMKGRQCKCGRRGCLQMYASIPMVRAKYRKISGEELTFREICRNAEKGNALAVETLDDMTDRLACGLTNAVNMFAPQKILIGFDGCILPSKYMTRLEKMVNEKSLPGDHIPFQKPALGRNAGIRGCTSRLLMDIFNGELL